MIEKLPIEVQVRGSAERRRVVAVLAFIRRHRGRANAVSMHLAAEWTGVPARTVQAIVKFLVEERNLPIGTATSKPFGYFWIETMGERRAVRDHFIRRALSNLAHARAFDTDSIVAPLVGQLEIDFPEVKHESK